MTNQDPSKPVGPATTLFGIPTTLTPSHWAVIRQVLTLFSGIAVGLGFVSATGAQHLVDNLMQLGTALTGALTAIGLAVAAFNSVVAAYKATEDQAKSRVSQLPNTMVVETTSTSSDVNNASKIAEIPGVRQVLSTPQIAASTTSDKVVSPDTPVTVERKTV